MRKQYTLTMDIEVHDVPSLYTAAKHHAINKDGLSRQEAHELLTLEDGSPDVKSCVLMLIDPGHILGGEINETTVEEMLLDRSIAEARQEAAAAKENAR